MFSARAGQSSFDNGGGSARPVRTTVTPDQAVVVYGETEEACYLGLRARATWTHCDVFVEAAHAILDESLALVVDLSECEYMDSTFLGTMHEVVARQGVRLQNVRPALHELLEELSLDSVLARIEDGGVTPARTSC